MTTSPFPRRLPMAGAGASAASADEATARPGAGAHRYGSRSEVLERPAIAVPALRIAGFRSPPLRPSIAP